MSEIPHPVVMINPTGISPVVLVCEHASNAIPDAYNGLGLAQDVLNAHIAWDPGAMGVAKDMAARLDAKLVASAVSRLVYDCNRPPCATDAVPEKSEIYAIPGNTGLDPAAKAKRAAQVYAPFRAQLVEALAATNAPILVTIHSFTPIYNGTRRDLDIGILHDADARLADAMLGLDQGELRVARNQPYGPEHGVTHTLKEHALGAGHLNVMIEIRNDLIATSAQQARFGALLAEWVEAALDLIPEQESASCKA